MQNYAYWNVFLYTKIFLQLDVQKTTLWSSQTSNIADLKFKDEVKCLFASKLKEE